jgi:hypothetical protein
MRRACFLLVMPVLACSSGSGAGETGNLPSSASAESCKAEYAPEKGYAWEDDLTTTTAPPDAAPPSVMAAPERAESECLGAGNPASTCDAELLMTREAALCIAESLGLSEGIGPWKAGLTYHFGDERIVWNVHSTLVDDGVGSQSGDFVTVDAIDGTSLGKGSWGSQP